MDLKTASDLVPSARKEGEALILAVRGEIDLHNSPELRTEILDLIGKNSPTRLILNLNLVPYMDSSACAVLVESLRRMRSLGGKVYLVGLQPRVKGLLEIARLGTIFTIVKDEAEALAG
jgi:anti-anti-sigma factor